MSSSYEEYDWTNPHENYRYERDQAIEMVPGAIPENLLFALEMAWMRGHHAGTELGWSAEGNPFKRPPADITSYTPEYKKLLWPYIPVVNLDGTVEKPEVDTETEQG